LPDGRIGKTIVDWDRGVTTAFDLGADPGETRPIHGPGEEWAALRPDRPEGAPAPSLDPDAARRLRALGYVH
jgi:hypothetical protein